MKKLIVCVALMLTGCMVPYIQPSTPGVGMDSDYAFSGRPQQPNGPLRSITTRAFNNTATDAVVTIVCCFGDGTVFGKDTKMVPAHDYSTFFIRGFTRYSVMNDSSVVSCMVVP